MISNKQRSKLRKILEKISTPEEMKAFDMEVLTKNNEKSSEKIIETIEKNKTEINWSFVESIINKTKESLSEKIDEIKKEFSNKKYPTYDDSELQDKIDLILKDKKDDKFIKDAAQKSQKQVIDELISIGDLLVSIRDISNKPKEESEGFTMINESLKGVGGILQKILSMTGTNDSFRVKDSNGTIINPAKEDGNLADIKSQTDKLTFTGNKLQVDATLDASDIEIGAVEIKDGTTDTRAVVGADGLQVEVKKSALPSGAATEAKQDDEITQLQTLNMVDFATEAKQDSILTELQKKADLTEEQPVYDEGNNQALTRLLEQVTTPVWYDAANNRLYTSSTIISGTVTTVTTVTGLTNIGGVPASSVVDDLSGVKWANSIRSLLI